MNYLGNGLSVYLITHGNGGLFFIPFKMNAIILNRKFGVRTVLRKYNSGYRTKSVAINADGTS